MRVRMAERQISQRELARLTGLSVGTIGAAYRGEPVVFDTLAKIATELDCNPIDLIVTEGFVAPLVAAPSA